MNKETKNNLLDTLKERVEGLETYLKSSFLSRSMKRKLKDHLEATQALIEKINEITK